MALCQQWSDHVWGGDRFIESGRHPMMGRYNRYQVQCQHCAASTLRTDWLDLPVGPTERAHDATLERS